MLGYAQIEEPIRRQTKSTDSGRCGSRRMMVHLTMGWEEPGRDLCKKGQKQWSRIASSKLFPKKSLLALQCLLLRNSWDARHHDESFQKNVSALISQCATREHVYTWKWVCWMNSLYLYHICRVIHSVVSVITRYAEQHICGSWFHSDLFYETRTSYMLRQLFFPTVGKHFAITANVSFPWNHPVKRCFGMTGVTFVAVIWGFPMLIKRMFVDSSCKCSSHPRSVQPATLQNDLSPMETP